MPLVCIFIVIFAGVFFAITDFATSVEQDATTDNKPHDFNSTVDNKPDKHHKAGWKDVQPRDVDDVADIPGRTQTISETVASWEECMDMAQERINYGTDQTYIIAQMEWDIAVCDRLFPANEAAGTDLAVPGVVP